MNSLIVTATNENAYVPFVTITIQSFHYSWFINSFVTRVTEPIYATSVAETSYPSSVFTEIRVVPSLVFCLILYRS